MSNPWIVDPGAPGALPVIDLQYVDPEGNTRPLWIKVKAELSVGEHRRMLRAVTSLSQAVPKVRGQEVTPEAKFEWTEYSFARMEAYIVDWSLAHDPESGLRLPANRDSYGKLRQEVFDLIDGALDAHERAVTEQKAARATSPEPAATSS